MTIWKGIQRLTCAHTSVFNFCFLQFESKKIWKTFNVRDKLTNSNTCTTNALKIVWTESMTIFLKSSLILVAALKWVYYCDHTTSTVTIVCLLKLHCTIGSIMKHYIPKFWEKNKENSLFNEMKWLSCNLKTIPSPYNLFH